MLRQFAKGDDDESGVGSENSGMDGKNGKSDHSDERAQDDGAECSDFLRQDADCDSEGDDDERAGDEHFFGVCRGVDVIVNVDGKSDEFLPVNDPKSRKNQKKKHEAWIGDDSCKILRCLAEADGLRLT